MAIQERTCKRCGHHWEVLRFYMKNLPQRPKCPECGSRASKVEIWGRKPHPPAVKFKGEGWTPKSGSTNDLREITDDPALQSALED
jgi:predicted nucleic acid-binding Zn ribbon protein